MGKPKDPLSVKPKQAAQGPAGSRQSLRFLLFFSLYLVVGFVVALAPFAQPAVLGLNRLVTAASAFLIRLCGGHAAANGDLLMGAGGGNVLRLANGCNGLHVTILLCAAVAAFPASPLRKMKGLAAGMALIHAVNLIRVISLFYLAPHGGVWFDLAHLYVWESLIVLGALAFFWRWAGDAYDSYACRAARP